MMRGARRLILTTTAFALAAGVNTASVALQQRDQFLTRRFGRRGWYVHLAVVLPPWAVFLALVPRLGGQVRWPLPRAVQVAGPPVLGVAASLWVLAYRQLGGTRMANGNIFGVGDATRVEGGLFRFVANPIYLSYLLTFIGLAFRQRNAVYLLLAGESYLLFNQLEARVENRHLPPPTQETAEDEHTRDARIWVLNERPRTRTDRAGDARVPAEPGTL